mmetsp:Transcript_81922/g.144617  ORF Transcript_81922/g.144617 Transcript_81922/m.144617 type:complete len:166 (-) Transcript_81922:168-665(-)
MMKRRLVLAWLFAFCLHDAASDGPAPLPDTPAPPPPPPTTPPPSAPAPEPVVVEAGGCLDTVIGYTDWTSNNGRTCCEYYSNDWCTTSGGYGSGWGNNGDFSEWANGGYTAVQACCSCGGGSNFGCYGGNCLEVVHCGAMALASCSGTLIWTVVLMSGLLTQSMF